MQDELNQFERNEVWSLVHIPNDINVIGTKWVFRNKTDESGKIVRNKARLVAQDYTQVEVLTLMRLLHRLLVSSPLDFCCPLYALKSSNYFKWISKVLF